MSPLETPGHVGPDGLLAVRLPTEFANADVIVSVRPVGEGEASRDLPDAESDEGVKKWREFFRKTAGSIEDPTFRRHDQGWYEERMPFE